MFYNFTIMVIITSEDMMLNYQEIKYGITEKLQVMRSPNVPVFKGKDNLTKI